MSPVAASIWSVLADDGNMLQKTSEMQQNGDLLKYNIDLVSRLETRHLSARGFVWAPVHAIFIILNIFIRSLLILISAEQPAGDFGETEA